MPTIKTHITNISTQKSYASVQDLEHTPAENLLKGETGRVFNFFVEYDNATVGFVHVYDKKGSITFGTDQPIMVFPVKGTTFGCSVMSQQGILISDGLSLAGSNTAGSGTSGAAPTGTIDIYVVGS